MPEELKKEIFEYSRIDKVDLDKLTRFKTAKAIEAAANNEDGTAGAGMGMGMGFAFAQQIGDALHKPQSQQPVRHSTPPPVPVAVQYYYAQNNMQQGPVGFEQLRSLFAARIINRNSLIWKQGMTEWKALQEIEELKSFLGGNTPPPLPAQ